MSAEDVLVVRQGSTGLDPVAAATLTARLEPATLFTGRGVVPAVVETVVGAGGWSGVGSTRTVRMADGTFITEVLTDLVPGEVYAYELRRLPVPFDLLVSGARSEVRFSPDVSGGTVVSWRFAFHPRPWRRLLVRALVAPLWGRYLNDSLARLVGSLWKAVPESADRH